MITSLISAIVGLFSGLAPDILKEFTASRAQKREIEFLEVQHRMSLERSKVEAEAKIREAVEGSVAAEVGALRDQLMAVLQIQATPTGVPWIDGFNALVRPVITVLVAGLFLATSVMFVKAVIIDYGAGNIKSAMELQQVIWGSMIGEAAQAMLGFTFGYRSVIKR